MQSDFGGGREQPGVISSSLQLVDVVFGEVFGRVLLVFEEAFRVFVEVVVHEVALLLERVGGVEHRPGCRLQD